MPDRSQQHSKHQHNRPGQRNRQGNHNITLVPTTSPSASSSDSAFSSNSSFASHSRSISNSASSTMSSSTPAPVPAPEVRRLASKLSSLESDNQLLNERFASIEVQMSSLQKTSSMESNSRREISKSVDSLSELVDSSEARLDSLQQQFNSTAQSSSSTHQLEAMQRELKIFKQASEQRMNALFSQVHKLQESQSKSDLREKESLDKNVVSEGFNAKLQQIESTVAQLKREIGKVVKDQSLQISGISLQQDPKETLDEKAPSLLGNSSSSPVPPPSVSSSSSTIRCSNLHPTTFNEDLLYFFGSRIGHVVSATVAEENEELIGLVTFKEGEDAKKAVETLNGSTFRQRPLNIHFSSVASLAQAVATASKSISPSTSLEFSTQSGNPAQPARQSRQPSSDAIKQESQTVAPQHHTSGNKPATLSARDQTRSSTTGGRQSESTAVASSTSADSTGKPPSQLEDAIAKMTGVIASTAAKAGNSTRNGNGIEKASGKEQGDGTGTRNGNGIVTTENKTMSRDSSSVDVKMKEESPEEEKRRKDEQAEEEARLSAIASLRSKKSRDFRPGTPSEPQTEQVPAPSGPRSKATDGLSSPSTSDNIFLPGGCFKLMEDPSIYGTRVPCYLVNNSQKTLMAFSTFEKLKSAAKGRISKMQPDRSLDDANPTLGSVTAPLQFWGKACSGPKAYHESSKSREVVGGVQNVNFGVVRFSSSEGGILLGPAAIKYLNIKLERGVHQLTYKNDNRIRTGLGAVSNFTGFPFSALSNSVQDGGSVPVLGKRKAAEDLDQDLNLYRRSNPARSGSAERDTNANRNDNEGGSLSLLSRVSSRVSGSNDGGGDGGGGGEGSSSSLLSRIKNDRFGNQIWQKENNLDDEEKESIERRTAKRAAAEKLESAKRQREATMESNGNSRDARSQSQALRGQYDSDRPEHDVSRRSTTNQQVYFRAPNSYKPSTSSSAEDYQSHHEDLGKRSRSSSSQDHSFPSQDPNDHVSRQRQGGGLHGAQRVPSGPSWTRARDGSLEAPSGGSGHHQLSGLGIGGSSNGIGSRSPHNQSGIDTSHSVVEHTPEDYEKAAAKAQAAIQHFEERKRVDGHSSGGIELGNQSPGSSTHGNLVQNSVSANEQHYGGHIMHQQSFSHHAPSTPLHPSLPSHPRHAAFRSYSPNQQQQ